MTHTDSFVIECTCGTRFRVPLSSSGRRGRCPRCMTVLVVPHVAVPAIVQQPLPLPAPPPLPAPAPAPVVIVQQSQGGDGGKIVAYVLLGIFAICVILPVLGSLGGIMFLSLLGSLFVPGLFLVPLMMIVIVGLLIWGCVVLVRWLVAKDKPHLVKKDEWI